LFFLLTINKNYICIRYCQYAKDAHSASSPSTPGKPAPGKRTPYQFLKIKGAKIQEKVIRVPSIDNNRPFEKTRTKNKKKPNANGEN
jgi:hypothetical protein